MSFGYATESDDEGSLAGRGSYLTQRFGWQWMAVEQGKSGRTVEAIEQLIATFAYLPLAWSLSIVTVFFWRLRLCIVLLPCLLRTPHWTMVFGGAKQGLRVRNHCILVCPRSHICI